jgi:penicillin-binding protein A
MSDGAGPRFRAALIALWVAVAVLALTWIVAGLPLRSAREALLEGRAEEAAARLERWSRARLRPHDYEQLLSASLLLAGRREAADQWLTRAARRPPDWFAAVDKREIGRLMINRGLYADFLRWDSAVRVRREPGEVRLYRAAAQLGEGRLDEARTTVASIRRSAVDPNRLAALEAGIARRNEGSFPLVLDRNGQPIAIWQIANNDLVAVNADFEPLIDRAWGELTIEAAQGPADTASILETTLDPRVQRAAIAALGSYRGSLVAIDPRTGDLLAIATTRGTGEAVNLAFAGMYEPGGAMAVVTGLASVERGNPSIFPLDCPGYLELGGGRMLDWAAHGRIASFEEGVAVSCQIALARLGVETGWPALQSILERLGFGQSAALPPLDVPLGRRSGPVESRMALAQTSAGHETVRLSALHLAIIASTIANDGTMTAPRLSRGRRSILGEAIGIESDRRATRVVDAPTARRMGQAMFASVNHPRGSARSAVGPGLPTVAVATGIGGDPLGGYDGIAVGFAPAENPTIAFGFVAENAGVADRAAAAILHQFLLNVPFE